MLDKGQEEDWFSSDFIRVLAVMAVVGLAAFVIRELFVRHPIVDLRVFKVGTYATGVFMMTVLGFVLYGSTVLIPIWLQTLMGYPALQAGWPCCRAGWDRSCLCPSSASCGQGGTAQTAGGRHHPGIGTSLFLLGGA